MTDGGIRLIQTNARGIPCGEGHSSAKFTDAQVEQARAMRAAGASLKDVVAVIGCSDATASDWCHFKRRRPHAKIIVKRILDP